MHTTSSDGLLSPRELVALAVRRGVTVMAITDHDTLRGAESLQGVATEIPVLTGAELSLRDMRRLHLLGYTLGDAAGMRRVLDQLAEMRLGRAREMIDRLAALGMPMDYDALRERCGGTVGRMHIAREMLRLGYIRTTQEAFQRWIGDDGPAYVAGERLSMKEALAEMHRHGFVPVLAHPAELGLEDVNLRMLLESWQKQGLMGVEVYHPSQAGKGFGALDAMVRRMGFLVTGGSDFHAERDGKHGEPGCTAPHWRRAEEDVAELMQAMQRAVGYNRN